MKIHSMWLPVLLIFGVVSIQLSDHGARRPRVFESVGVALRPADPKAELLRTYGKRPLSFEANRGQTNPVVKFLSRGAGYTVFLTGQEAVLSLWSRDERTTNTPVPPPLRINQPGAFASAVPERPSDRVTPAWNVVRMQLVGAKDGPPVQGLDELGSTVDYFLGNDPEKWHGGVTTYGKVKYSGVYPGIDLIFYGNQERLEYDFIVAPGASPQAIRLAFEGTERLEMNERGDLLLRLQGREVRFEKPNVYQEDPTTTGKRRVIDGRYVIDAQQRVSFAIGAYDPTQPLVIDPVLQYSTYFGGSNRDQAVGISVDPLGRVWVTGTTRSADFPTAATGSSSTFNGGLCGTLPCRDVFVAQFDTTASGASALRYSAFIGGTDDDIAFNLTVDPASGAMVYVTGSTLSSDFPTTLSAFQTVYSGAGGFGSGDAFVLGLAPGSKIKQKPKGPTNDLVFSTYLGGSGDETAYTVVLERGKGKSNLYLTGFTTSPDFPSTPGAFRTACTNSPCYNAFVTKMPTNMNALTYSTFLGGTLGGMINSASGIAIDKDGNAYVAGITASPDFPVTAGSYQQQCGTDGQCDGTTDGFLAKLNTAGSGLVWATFLGGGAFDYAYGVGVSFTGDATYVTGGTVSADFPTTAGAAQGVYGGGSGCATYNCGDVFATKLNLAGSALVYSTYIGGSGDEGPFHPSVQFGTPAGSGDIFYIVGSTNSAANFPVVNALQPTFGGGSVDGFLTVIDKNGAFYSSSYLGGSGEDTAVSVATAPRQPGTAFVAGGTLSTDYPVTTGSFQSTCGTDGTCNGGLRDAFVMKISGAGPLP